MNRYIFFLESIVVLLFFFFIIIGFVIFYIFVYGVEEVFLVEGFVILIYVVFIIVIDFGYCGWKILILFLKENDFCKRICKFFFYLI